MGIIIGIDVGISTTKIIGIKDGEVVSPIRITAIDPVTSLYGAFGKYLHDTGISLTDIEHIMLTGVGSAYIDKPVYGLPTTKVEEFLADGLVKCVGDDICHIGGIGAGGGTLQGLSRLLLNTGDIDYVCDLATKGNLANINLLIGDISASPLPGLPMDATASLFGKAQSNAQPEDVARGLIYMVLQSIGSAAVLAAIGSTIKDFVLIGNLTLLPACKDIFPAIGKLYGVRFHIPQHSEFCTAIGAGLNYFNNK